MANEVTKAKRESKAEHHYLDSQGVVTEDMTQAVGIRYIDLATKETFDYMVKPGTPGAMMGACFGFRTLATNEASQARQKGEADQVGAIRERFALIDSGQWVDRSREGAAIDRDVLAEAAVQVLAECGGLGDSPTDETIGEAKAKLRQKFDDDSTAISKARQVAGVSTTTGRAVTVAGRYAELMGRTTRTVDDLAGLLG